MSKPHRPGVTIRRATPDDAEGIASVLGVVAAERIHSAVDEAWTPEQERRFLASLSPREAVHVAVDETRRIVGLQIADRWSPVLTSMAHVAQVGTFLLPEWRGRGIGRCMWDETERFVAHAGYRKVVIQVRSSNRAAQAFYRAIGFEVCGRLARQVIIDGIEDDEIMMERFIHT